MGSPLPRGGDERKDDITWSILLTSVVDFSAGEGLHYNHQKSGPLDWQSWTAPCSHSLHLAQGHFAARKAILLYV